MKRIFVYAIFWPIKLAMIHPHIRVIIPAFQAQKRGLQHQIEVPSYHNSNFDIPTSHYTPDQIPQSTQSHIYP